MRRLVESWITAEKEFHGNTLAAAIRRMNERHDYHLTHSRVSEWRRGVYVPSQMTLSQILYRTLPWALQKAGIQVTNEKFQALTSLLWNVVEKDGQRRVELL